MGHKGRTRVASQQRVRRKKKREKIVKQGKNPDDFYIGHHYVGPKGAGSIS